ncbi:hypothetical protein PAXRUDRAFT_826539 [Paxillus rubicundulus Ve08.2h10]|uniref:Uncharacterized protein n=1 Tax=Paxillus rubicundulus Ve08.2h10 TaxID=930991 RepID=A0A0D0DZF6_9AGAM|nr:hypothetical protein PAXRUDRAFT_826539 [Paxillus rubicundulus Ve08.2h10]
MMHVVDCTVVYDNNTTWTNKRGQLQSLMITDCPNLVSGIISRPSCGSPMSSSCWKV